MLKINSQFSNLAKKTALWLHAQHAKAYSYYKVQESKIITNAPLTATERDFYLKLRLGLQGNNLTVYDIGAAKGIVSSCLAKLPNVSQIHAFEPIPKIYAQLEANMQLVPKVNCHNVALGNTSGLSTMYISNKTDSSSLLPMAELHKTQMPINLDITHQIQVPVVRLDDYVKQQKLSKPYLIKIDVQGYEKNIIEGGINTISQAKHCILEMSFHSLYEGSPLFDDIYRLMRSLNFNLIGLSSPLLGKSGIQLQVDGIFENQQ